MDIQDHRKNHTPEHESHAGHVCHKCGWPFPNPHPSAKHRRAHKKICGSIEGYKFVDSEEALLLPVSDDDHHSDEDRKTPSPKVIDKSKNEEDGSALGLRSNRSEDEMFSDAVAEFADSGSSPRIEDPLGNVDKIATYVETVETAARPDEDRTINVMVPPPSDPADSRTQIRDSDVSGSHLPDSAQEPLKHVLSSADGLMDGSLMDFRSQESAYALPDEKEGSLGSSNPVKLETQIDVSHENDENNGGECLVNFEEKGNEGTSVDIQLQGFAASPGDAAVKTYKSGEMTSDPVPVSGVVQRKTEIPEEFVSKDMLNNLSCEDKPAEGMNAPIRPDCIEVDAGGVAMDSAGANDGKQEENMVMFAVPDTVPAVGDPEIMIKGFKGHKGGELPQFINVESFNKITDAKHSVPEDNNVSFNSNQLNEGTENNLSCEERSIEGTNASIHSDHIKVDAGAAMDSANFGSSVGGNDGEEEENIHMFAVPETVPAVGDPEIMIKGFKDLKGGKFPQSVNLELFDKMTDVEHSVPEDIPVSFNSSQLNEGTEVCASEMQVLKGNPEQKVGSSEIVEQLPAEGEADVPQINSSVNESRRSEESGIITYTGAIETEKSETLQSPEEYLATNCCEDSTQTTSVGHATEAVPDLVVSPTDAEVCQATYLLGKNDTDSYDETKTERYYEVENDNNEGIGCTENIIAVSEPASSLNLTGRPNNTSDEVQKIEHCKASGIQTAKGDSASPADENILGKSATSSESTGDLHVASVNAINDSDVRVTEPENINLGRVSDSQDCVQELDKVHSQCVGVVGAAAEAHNETEVLEKPVDGHTMEDSLASPLGTSCSDRNATLINDNHARDFNVVDPGKRFESSSAEGDNLVSQQLGASATDFSVDSISQTDSLEGHWGSVSVLSTLSDIPAIADTEPLPSIGSQVSADAEKESLNPKAATERQYSEKSDVFEAPSFMTLVEPTGEGDLKAADAEILSQQNLQQPKATPLQAGWFPSITHVVNDSQGRKKNEEIIAKVTNWSAGKEHSPLKGQPRTPLKNLLGEANAGMKPRSPKAKETPAPLVQKDTAAKDNGALTATVNAILGPEPQVAETIKKEEGREWNSPARYPAGIKREKRKAKRPYWAQLMCCSSVN